MVWAQSARVNIGFINFINAGRATIIIFDAKLAHKKQSRKIIFKKCCSNKNKSIPLHLESADRGRLNPFQNKQQQDTRQ